jgi:hypothetical protein
MGKLICPTDPTKSTNIAFYTPHWRQPYKERYAISLDGAYLKLSLPAP